MGIALLRSGNTEAAKRFFERAVERLPGYYLAEEHLAECEAALGETEAARSRYRRVIDQTGNPEFIAALASLEHAAGRHDDAKRLQTEALRGYEALLQRHPDAFGQHAAEFLIEVGEVERADALAQANLALRKDVGSWILQATTALAANDTARACAARDAAVRTALLPPELAELDSLAPRCR
jgi:tetratricopeptide (TPR) repeat protein